MKIQKNDGICVPSNMAKDGTNLKKFSNDVRRSNLQLLIIAQLRSKLNKPFFLVEKELHYDNVIRLCVLLYFWCELPLRNASEGSLIILKMTAVKNCWKTTRIYNRIIRSIREQRFWEQRSFQICHYLCFLNSIFIFSEPGKWINEIGEILKQFTSNGGKTPWIFVIA